MRLARQSSKMPKKYQQEIIFKVGGEVDRLTRQIKQAQLLESNLFHSPGKDNNYHANFAQTKRGAPT